MKLDGTIEIAAGASDVWTLINDPVSLSACVPGVSDVRQIDDRTFEGSVSASVGPIDGQFAFHSVITRAGYPDDLGVDVEGVDSVTKSRVLAQVTVGLAELTPGTTLLRYHAIVTVKGRLSILGEMVLRATAGMMIGQVTKCLRSRLESVTSGDAVGR
jgi:carbon monoxide dehydrogenase subunit G